MIVKIQYRKLKFGQKTAVRLEGCMKPPCRCFWINRCGLDEQGSNACPSCMHRVCSVLCYTVAKAECGWWEIKLLLNMPHWQAWYCSQGSVWASYVLQKRENVAYTAPKSHLDLCHDQCCSSRAALQSQVIRQTCAWAIQAVSLPQPWL